MKASAGLALVGIWAFLLPPFLGLGSSSAVVVAERSPRRLSGQGRGRGHGGDGQVPLRGWSGDHAAMGKEKEKEKEKERGNNRVKVELAVMSRCPDALVCEATMDRVLAYPGIREKIDLEMRYIAELNATSPYGVSCKHGDVECRGNIHQLCIQHLLPSSPAASSTSSSSSSSTSSASGSATATILSPNPPPVWSFIQSSDFLDPSRIGSDGYAEECARNVGIDWWESGVGECVTGTKEEAVVEGDEERSVNVSVNVGSLGKRLAIRSAVGLKKEQVGKSCTILLNSEIRCIHDGEWYDCDEGHEVGDLVRSIEEAYEEMNDQRS